MHNAAFHESGWPRDGAPVQGSVTYAMVGERAALMHAGQFASIAQALEHYNRAPPAESGHSELKPLNLSPAEMRQLEAFLRTLSGGITRRRAS